MNSGKSFFARALARFGWRLVRRGEPAADSRRTLLELNAILDNASTGILLTRDRIIERCNRRGAEIFSYTSAELIGKHTRILYPNDDSYEVIGREAAPRLAAGESYHADWLGLKKSGETVWCTIYGKAVDPAHPEFGTVWIIEDRKSVV